MDNSKVTTSNLHIITIIKNFFLIIVVLLFAVFFLGQMLFPDERDSLNTNCRIFEANWQRIMEDGSRIETELPGKVPAQHGEIVRLVTTLPQDFYTGENITFRPVWQDVNIYIDGELRLSHSTKDSRPFGTNSPMRYLFIELSEEDRGKELIYESVSYSKYSGYMTNCYIGDRMSIWVHLAEISGAKTIVAAFLLLLSISCIVVCLILKMVYKRTLPLTYLAWTIFFAAFWMLSEVEFRQIMIKNISLLSNHTYWCLMIIPIPLLLYINEIQGGRYRKIFLIPMIYSCTILVVGTPLQVLDIMQFVQQLPFIHFGIIISIVFIITTITLDTVKKQMNDYLAVGIGIYGMLLTAIGEMVLYYVGSSLSLGTTLAIGLVFLLIMAIIKTGQDLFQTEKKKQQAIMAREAQAKFLANMSHEIRTPINAIIGMNEMILRENEDNAIHGYAHNIQSASNMLLGLVNDVLDFSKIESGQLELVEDTYDLPQLLQDEMLLLRARAGEKPLSIQMDADPGLPSKLFGDELRIKQILTNLLSNAVKYTQQGSVTLKAYCNRIDDTNIMLSFAIIDTGIGIHKEDLSQLFDSFKRLELSKNRNIQGTGLGLNIAKQLATLMKGDILVESEYGKGSTFTVAFPQKVIDRTPIGILQQKNIHREENHSMGHLFTAPDARILVVDDNAMNLALMKGLLKRTKIQVDVAESGKECLQMTKEAKYHLIFMDHMMPDLDGVETLHLLRADASNPNRKTGVIVLTANAIAGCRETYLEYGFDDYFAKPVLADKLDALLLQYLPEHLVQKQDAYVVDNSQVPSAKLQNPDDILYINKENGLIFCMNSEDLYTQMLSSFCKQAKEYLPKLDSCFTSKDLKSYAIFAHGLKGNALNIGAENFSKLSLQHELAAKEQRTNFIEENYNEYVDILKELIQRIEKMI